MLVKGSTAIEGLSGNAKAGLGVCAESSALSSRSCPTVTADRPLPGDALAKIPLPSYVYPNWIYKGDGVMASSTVFTSNRSQAVRLPKAVAFPADVHQVDILKIGRSRVIVPQGKRWDDLFQNGPRARQDFMVERGQPAAEEREPL
jgi:antitoxin VapB